MFEACSSSTATVGQRTVFPLPHILATALGLATALSVVCSRIAFGVSSGANMVVDVDLLDPQLNLSGILEEEFAAALLEEDTDVDDLSLVGREVAVSAAAASDAGCGDGDGGGGGCTTAAAAWDPVLVPLRKLAVPVRRNGRIVSYKYSYAGNISIGFPKAQEFTVVFDTGSGQIVVPSSTCKSAACLKHRSYKLEDSMSGQPVNADGRLPVENRDEVEIVYGTGLAVGDFVREKVCVGEGRAAARGDGPLPSAPTLCVEMSVVTATELSASPFGEFEFDGIFGLGLSGLAVTKDFSFFHRFRQLHEGPSQFGIFLAGSDDIEGHELALGGVNSERLKGPLSWIRAVRPELGYWQVEVRGIRIGDERLDICGDGSCSAIVDSGSSHMGVPKTSLREIYEKLSSKANGVSDCRNADSPPLHIELDGLVLTISAKNYMRKLATEDYRPPESEGTEEPGRPSCRPRLMPVALPEQFSRNTFIIGEPVLLRYYAAFDSAKQQVAFGLAERPGEEAEREAALDSVSMVQMAMRTRVMQSVDDETLERDAALDSFAL